MENISQPTSATQPLPKAWDLFNQSISFYKENFKVIFQILIVPFIIVLIGAFFLSIGGATSESGLKPVSTGIIPLLIVGIIFAIAGGILSYLSFIALIQLFNDKAKGSSFLGIKESYKKAAKSFWPFVWVSLLGGLATIGGFLLFIVPGIILSFYLLFGVYVLLDEDKRGIQALIGSWNYVKGYAPSIFLKYLFLMLMYVPLLILFIILGILVGNSGSMGVETFTRIIEHFIGTPIIMIYSYLLYQNLKSIKNSAGLVVDEAEDEKKRKKLIGVSIFGLVIFPVIIGSVVLVSLNSAKTKAEEAAERSKQRQIQIEKELEEGTSISS